MSRSSLLPVPGEPLGALLFRAPPLRTMLLRTMLLGAMLFGAMLLGGCAAAPGLAPPAAPPAARLATAPAPRPASTMPLLVVAALAPSEPVGLEVPAIGIHTGPLLPLGIDGDGGLQVPPDAGSAGWFTLGPTPGATGPAVIAAHVDYAGVPGVFVRLHDLIPGQEVRVPRADGTQAVFTTYRVEHFPKVNFPTEEVYGDTSGPELRLITCGGSFDQATGQYRDNIVAYARLTAVH